MSVYEAILWGIILGFVINLPRIICLVYQQICFKKEIAALKKASWRTSLKIMISNGISRQCKPN